MLMHNGFSTANYLDIGTPVYQIGSGFHQVLLALIPEPCADGQLFEMDFKSVSLAVALEAIHKEPPLAVMIVFDPFFHFTLDFQQLKDHLDSQSVPLLLYSRAFSRQACAMAREFGFDDYFFGLFSESLWKKFHIINQTKVQRNRAVPQRPATRKSSKAGSLLLKRLLDVSVSVLILVMLSPLLLLIALIIKLESRGPVFYVSKRAGNNYQVFDFYKFRSMNDGAEAELKALMSENQYANGAFVKIKSDPRVTSFGAFLRKTSLDEIPQLINVIKGDMYLVGNRPLPLYEAIELTKDQSARRFLAPAGITGLWQITKRGKEDMSAEERIHLDIVYARKTSFLYDMKLLINTIPAMWQKESV